MYYQPLHTTEWNDARYAGAQLDYIAQIGGAIDESFMMTLRALLYKRLPEGKSFIFKPQDFYSPSTADLVICKNASHDYGLENDWEKPEIVNRYVTQNAPCVNTRIYVNEKTNQAVIVAPDLDIKQFHFLQQTITHLFPCYFKDQPLGKDEIELLKSFDSDNLPLIKSLYAKLFDASGIKEKVKREKLSTFVTEMKKTELDRRQRMVDKLRSDADDLLRRYSNVLSDLKDANYNLQGFKISMREGIEDELLSYLDSNPNVYVVDTSPGGIDIIAKGFLDQVDSDALIEYIENDDSYLYYPEYEYSDAFNDTDDRIALIEALWGYNPKFKLLTCGYYSLRFENEARSVSGYDYPEDIIGGAIPNPHINKYACLGNYGPLITQKMNNCDVIGAIDQCLLSVRSLNICEDVSVNELLDWLFTTDKMCLMNIETGELLTPAQALEQI